MGIGGGWEMIDRTTPKPRPEYFFLKQKYFPLLLIPPCPKIDGQAKFYTLKYIVIRIVRHAAHKFSTIGLFFVNSTLC